jgi:hypothetical protein
MARTPAFFMVTIHNVEYPGGAIRGQLGPAGKSIPCELGIASLCPGP